MTKQAALMKNKQKHQLRTEESKLIYTGADSNLYFRCPKSNETLAFVLRRDQLERILNNSENQITPKKRVQKT